MANVSDFEKAFTYTCTFRDETGKPVLTENVCIVAHGVKPEAVFQSWLGFPLYQFSYGNVISVQEALSMPTARDHLSLQGKIDIVSDGVPFLTHTASVRDFVANAC
jgi:hypothetical protein